MITAGIWVVFPFLQYFFRDVAHVAKAADFTDMWLLVVLLAATPFGFAGGWLSDRLGRKKFVYGSGAAMSVVVAVFIALFPTQVPLFYILGIVYGLGYGLYYAVDWALACDTLPDRTRPAKDMGLFHVAYTLPQVLLPSAFGFVLDAFNRAGGNAGYRVVFSSAIVFYLLGTILVSRIRSVR
jgi:MFS family permease